ncbi:MAG: hypothetical protein ABIR51_06725, partial [Sphingomicrobium sp.]
SAFDPLRKVGQLAKEMRMSQSTLIQRISFAWRTLRVLTLLDRGVHEKALCFIERSGPPTVYPLQQTALRVRVLMLCRKLDLARETSLAATQMEKLDLAMQDERAALFYLHYVGAVLAGDIVAIEVCKSEAIRLAERPATLSIFGFKQ